MDDTLPKLLLRNSQSWGGRLAVRKKEYGIWQRYTWKDCYEKTRDICLALSGLGFGAGENACILGDSNPEWLWSELAVQAAGGVVVALDPGSSIEETRMLLALTQARYVLVQDQEQVDKVLESKRALPLLERVIFWREKGLRHYVDPLLLSLAECSRLASDFENRDPGQFERRIAQGKDTDTAMLLLTRGAEGAYDVLPVTHELLISSATRAMAANPATWNDDYVSLSPPGWLFEQVLGFCASLLTGQKLNFPETPGTGMVDFREISPQVVLYRSATWQATVDAIQNNMKKGNWLKRALYDCSVFIGHRRADSLGGSGKTGLWGAILKSIADAMALRALRDKHGLNRARIAYAAGETLSSEASRYLCAIGVDIKQVYGSAKDGVVSAPVSEPITIAP